MATLRRAQTVPDIFLEMNYGENLEGKDIVEMWLKEVELAPYIDGKWILKKDAPMTNLINPNSGEVLASVRNATIEDVKDALESSIQAQEIWKQKSNTERNSTLFKIGQQITKETPLLAQLEAISTGTNFRITKDFDIPLASKLFSYYANFCQSMQDDNQNTGVTLLLTSSTSSLATLAWKIAPILSTGGTVCIKPSSKYPQLALVLANICVKAGLPKGIVNVLPGNREVGSAIVQNENVRHVCFQGSAAASAEIRASIAGCNKSLSFLLDGKSAMIVFDSADLDSAAEEFIRSAWTYHIKFPWAVRSLLIQESVYDIFIEKVKKRMKNLYITNAFDKNGTLGPLYKENVNGNMMKTIEIAKQKGIEVIQTVDTPDFESNFYFIPSILLGAASRTNNILHDDYDETILPCVTLLPFRTPKEGITLANNSKFGLAASVWTENISLAFTVSKQLEVGTVWLNCHGKFMASVPVCPWKRSGIGSFGGVEGLLINVNSISMQKKQDINYSNYSSESSVFKRSDSKYQYKLYYAGSFKAPTSDLLCNPVFDINKKQFATFAFGLRDDVAHAMKAALSAVPFWMNTTADYRSQVLRSLAGQVEQNKEALFCKLSDLGITVAQLSSYAEQLLHWAAAVSASSNLSSSMYVENNNIMVFRYPVGIIAIFDNGNDNQYILNALAAAIGYGNIVIICSTSVLLMELCNMLTSSGITAGVVSVLTGDSVITSVALHQCIQNIWYLGGESRLFQYLEWWTASQNMKQIVAIPQTAPKTLWEHYATLSKVIWLPAVDIFAN